MLFVLTRIALIALLTGFVGWLGYVIWLGIQAFFKIGRFACLRDGGSSASAKEISGQA